MSDLPKKATIKKEHYELLAACRTSGDRDKLAFALLARLFEGVAPTLPKHLQVLFDLIEREILYSEKQRRNGLKKWYTGTVGIMPRNEPSTEPRNKQRTEPRNEPRNKPSNKPVPAHPETAPARESNNIILENNNIKNNITQEKTRDKSLVKKNPPYPVQNDLRGEYCCALPPEYQAKWDEWEKYYLERNRRKMPPTTAYRQIKRLLEFSPDEMAKVIEFSIERGYQGLFFDRALGKPAVVLQTVKKDYTGV